MFRKSFSEDVPLTDVEKQERLLKTLGTKDENIQLSDSQQYPLKLCLIKYESDINVYNLEKWLFSTMGSPN